MARTRVVVGLLLTWQIADSYWFLSAIAAGHLDILGLGRYVFYKLMFLALASVFLLRQLDARQDAARRGEVRELVEFDLTKQFVPFMLVGAPTGVILALTYSGLGYPLAMPSMDYLVEQAVVVVPYETFIFVFFLPKLLPDYLGIPSWIWSSASFGGFHYYAFQGDLLAMGIAFGFNIGWYLMYRAGERYSFLGIGAVMAMHFAVNALGQAVQPGAAAAATVLGPLLLDPFIPALGSMLAWRELGRRRWRSSWRWPSRRS
jgi:hypothetical protein